MPNFTLYVRHAEIDENTTLRESETQEKSESAYEVWDAAYIQDKLTRAMKIQKVYVSGPPRLNDSLEQAIDQVYEKLMFEKQCIEIV